MLDLPVMIAVIICLLIAWERSRREDDTEEWEDEGTTQSGPSGTPAPTDTAEGEVRE